VVIGCKASISVAHTSVTTPDKRFFHCFPANVLNLMLNYPTISLSGPQSSKSLDKFEEKTLTQEY